MKLFAILATCLFAVTHASKSPAFLNIPRGGGAIGPLDSDLALNLSKTAVTAYVAGSASKYINKQTGGTDSQLSEFFTGDLFQLHALITSVACAMFNLSGTGFDSLKMIAVSAMGGVALRLKSDGVSTDAVKQNAAQTGIAAVLAFIAFVE